MEMLLLLTNKYGCLSFDAISDNVEWRLRSLTCYRLLRMHFFVQFLQQLTRFWLM